MRSCKSPTIMQKGSMELNKYRYCLLFFLLSVVLSFVSCKQDKMTIPIGEDESETIPIATEENIVNADHPLFTMERIQDGWMITGLTAEGATALELTIPAYWQNTLVTRVGYLMSPTLRSLRTEEGANLTFDQRSIASMPELTELVFQGEHITVGESCFIDCPKLLAIQVVDGSEVSFGNAVMNGNQDPLYIMFLDSSRVSVGSHSFLKTGSLSLGKNASLSVDGNSFGEAGNLYLSEGAALLAGDHSFGHADGIVLEKGASVQIGNYSFAEAESIDLMENASFTMGDYCLTKSEAGCRLNLGKGASLIGGSSCLGSIAALSLDSGAKVDLGAKSLHAFGSAAMLTAEADTSLTIGDESAVNFKMMTFNGNSAVQAGNRCFVGYSVTLALTMGNSAQIQAGNGCFQNVGQLVLGDGCRLQAGDYAFAYSDTLSSVTLPRGFELGEYAFAHSNKLTTIRLADGFNDIASHSFFGCRSLSRAEVPATVTHIGGAAFKDTSDTLAIYGKSGSVAAYYAAENNITFHEH